MIVDQQQSQPVFQGASNHDIEFVQLLGDFNVSAKDAFDAQFDRLVCCWHDSIVVDLSCVATIDDAGLEMLARLQRYVEFRGGRLIVCGANPRIGRALDRMAIVQ